MGEPGFESNVAAVFIGTTTARTIRARATSQILIIEFNYSICAFKAKAKEKWMRLFYQTFLMRLFRGRTGLKMG
jgi:hypothetical protein